jgi:hypothetical protein
MNKGQPPTAPRAARAGDAPSDFELMQFFDGELEEPRRSVVAAFVAADRRALNKLSGMRITSVLVQEQARSHAAADGIADLVMAKIAAESRVAPQIAAPIVQPMAPAQSAPMPVHFAQMGPPIALRKPAANDNSRRIFAVMGALAVAAAAAFAVMWGRSGETPHGPSTSQPVAVNTAPSVPASAPRGTQPDIEAGALPGETPEGDAEHGVEVAAVNFGAHMGSIFYVPSGSREAKRATTVVWLADDAGE